MNQPAVKATCLAALAGSLATACGGGSNSSSSVSCLADGVCQSACAADLWVSRFEIGNEIYDGSSGQTTIRTLTYEVNGQSYASVPAL